MTAAFGTTLGALLLAGGLICFVLGIFATLRSVALFAGAVLVGVSGHVLGWMTSILDSLASVTSGLFAWAFGVAFPGLLALILAVYVAKTWHPRNKAGRMSSVAALALGVMVAAGITQLQLLQQAGSAIHGVGG